MEKVKKFFESAWKWLKSNWLIVVIILGVLALAVNAFSQFDQNAVYRNLLDQYQEQSLDHQRQLKDLRDLVDAEREERDRLLQEYLAEMHRIEREYKEDLERIAQERDTTQDDIIRDHSRDPTTLTRAVHETFGIPVE